jgi:putative acyl-CoA dehydrogenase
MPRWRPDGTRNALELMRLKDKLGNHSNASSEIEFRDAFAWLVGEPGRGIQTIIQMVALTRFNCMVGSTAIMRHAAIQALHHVRHRAVGGRRLADAPLMRNVVADLLLETEAALALTFRVAAALDAHEHDPREAAFVRLATALGKYWICKRAPGHINEAQECLGGLGYVEEHVLPRLYREAPVNSIWEGSGNVQCLDVLRALARQPEALQVLVDELALARGESQCYDRAVDGLRDALTQALADESHARWLAERMAVLLQAGLLIRHDTGGVGAVFAEARLEPRSLAYGALPDPTIADALFETIDTPVSHAMPRSRLSSR